MSKYDKESVMRNLYKMKDSADANINKLQVGYDMSQDERESVKAKIAEAKAKGTDEVFWAVRGPPWALRLVKTERRRTSPASPTGPPA